WARTWGGRLLPLLLAGVALLVVVQRLVTPAPTGAVHGELGRLAAVNETVGFALMVGALVSAYRLLSFDLSSEFESLSSRGNLGADAAYQRAALADGFIAPSGLYSIEEAVAWLLPRPLVDPFTGLLLMDKSVALQQFPVRQGTGVWGWDLIQVSGQADIALFA